MSSRKKQNFNRLSVGFPEELKIALEKAAMEDGMSVVDEVRRAVRLYIKVRQEMKNGTQIFLKYSDEDSPREIILI